MPLIETGLGVATAPIGERKFTVGLPRATCCTKIFWRNLATVHHARRHVLVLRLWVVKLDQHVSFIKEFACDLSHTELLTILP